MNSNDNPRVRVEMKGDEDELIEDMAKLLLHDLDALDTLQVTDHFGIDVTEAIRERVAARAVELVVADLEANGTVRREGDMIILNTKH